MHIFQLNALFFPSVFNFSCLFLNCFEFCLQCLHFDIITEDVWCSHRFLNFGLLLAKILKLLL
ncbi:Uncharacterised protein [Mycobacteroides abscessus subsp. abscessus]|nr:Uncharacterised protein [Mycobacteroides abscessus subsp. abscessus]